MKRWDGAQAVVGVREVGWCRVGSVGVCTPAIHFGRPSSWFEEGPALLFSEVALLTAVRFQGHEHSGSGSCQEDGHRVPGVDPTSSTSSGKPCVSVITSRDLCCLLVKPGQTWAWPQTHVCTGGDLCTRLLSGSCLPCAQLRPCCWPRTGAVWLAGRKGGNREAHPH